MWRTQIAVRLPQYQGQLLVAAPPAVVLTTSVDFPGDVFCTGEEDDVDFIATNIGGATYEYEIGSGGRVAVGSSSFTIPYAQLAALQQLQYM